MGKALGYDLLMKLLHVPLQQLCFRLYRNYVSLRFPRLPCSPFCLSLTLFSATCISYIDHRDQCIPSCFPSGSHFPVCLWRRLDFRIRGSLFRIWRNKHSNEPFRNFRVSRSSLNFIPGYKRTTSCYRRTSSSESWRPSSPSWWPSCFERNDNQTRAVEIWRTGSRSNATKETNAGRKRYDGRVGS